MIGETNASTSAGGSSVYYGTCSTPASTTAKAVTVGEKFKLVQGAMIVVTFTNANSASTPTLNVTPSGGSATGAKYIRINASSALDSVNNPETDYYAVRGTCEFIYNGTYWILVTGRKTSRSLRLDDSSGTSLGVYYPTGRNNTQVITLPMGSRELTDVQAVFTLQATPDYAEFPYCAEITDSGVTPNTYVSVTYSNEQSQSLMYSPTAVSDTGKIKLYARQAVGTQTIPTIGIGMDYVDLDSSQPISSPIETRTLTLVSSTDTEYTGFPYKYSFACVGATATRTAEVIFDVGDATSGNFVPICETGAGVLYIWSKVSQSTARIGYMLYYTDTVAIAGAVDLSSNQTVGGLKTFTSNVMVNSLNPIGTAHWPNTIVQNDVNGAYLYALRCESSSQGKAIPYITARNADGTTRDFLLDPTPISLTSQVTVDANQGTFNTTYSSVVRSGNVVSITIGGSNIGGGLNQSYYLYNIPRAFRPVYCPIYDFAKQKLLGYYSIVQGEKILRATTYDSGVSSAITTQITYITDE